MVLRKQKLSRRLLIGLALVFLISACDKNELIEPPGIEVNMADDTVIFAVIGDYGNDSDNEANVAAMVSSWQPDFIITTGDNNYPSGEMETIEANISDHYGDYIYNFDAPDEYRCNGNAFDEQVNRFFPSPGNHDTYGLNGMTPYLNFFTLPGNEKYYRFSWGELDFFSLNSTATFMGEQEAWLEEQLVNSTGKFRIVYFHHSPYSTGKHGNERKMQFDYQGLDVDFVFTGHDHIYSRIEKDDEPGMYYIVTGAGGKSLYECGANELDTDLFSVICNDQDYGAVRGIYDGTSLVVEYFTVSDTLAAFDMIEYF